MDDGSKIRYYSYISTIEDVFEKERHFINGAIQTDHKLKTKELKNIIQEGYKNHLCFIFIEKKRISKKKYLKLIQY